LPDKEIKILAERELKKRLILDFKLYESGKLNLTIYIGA
jgi:hypothetical protein